MCAYARAVYSRPHHYPSITPLRTSTGARRVPDGGDAIDLNFGCPQQIARRGHYGSFLLEETQLVQRLVRRLRDGLRVPVTVKMRVVLDDPTGAKTVALARALQDSGASLLTLHGRTREMIKQKIGPCDFEIIARVKRVRRAVH